MTAQLPFAQSGPLQVPAQLRQLQAQGPIHKVRTRVGHDAWLVTGYEEVRHLLGDERLGRAHPDPANAARTGDSALFGGPVGNFQTEAADNARMHALLQPQFSARRMRTLRPRVEALTADLLDAFSRQDPPADLVQTLALPLPILVICELLGVPYADRDMFRAWTDAIGDVTDRARSERGLADLFGYGLELVVRKRSAPADDFISRLCAQGIPDHHVAGMAMQMLFAGHETTVVAIGMGVLSLITNPDQQQALVEDPSLIPSAVEEMLRLPGGGGGGGGIPRYAKVTMRVGEETIHAGDLVLLDSRSANHDSSAFADADRFLVSRAGLPHLSFGYGPHYCLGAPLARIELQTVIGQLIKRFPRLRLAVPIEDLKVARDRLTRGLVALPVAW